MKRIYTQGLLLFFLIGLISCNNDDNSINEETARMSIKLVDAPGDYDAVSIDVQDIMITYSGAQNEVSIGDVNVGVYDLLQLTGGTSALLADTEIAIGVIDQMRLVLGDNNTIVVNGNTVSLHTPSTEQSGLELPINQILEVGSNYEFILDFDVENSIVDAGNGNYNLIPVINPSNAAQTGSLIGSITPIGIPTLITGCVDSCNISTYVDLITGNFVLNGLTETNNLNLIYEPDPSSGFTGGINDGYSITIGQVTDVGVLELYPE